MPRGRPAGKSFNGVQLGLGSPLIDQPPRRRYLGPSEFQVQSQLVDLLLGVLALDGPYKGKRVPGAGYTRKYPELSSLYAVPNGGHRLKFAAGKAKAEGVLEAVPDLVLPVPRYPFHGLYVEMKTLGGQLRVDQRELLLELIARGYLGAECRGTQEGLDVFLAYLQLPKWPEPAELLAHRARALARIQPRPIKPPRNG